MGYMGILLCYYNMPKARFYLLKGNYRGVEAVFEAERGVMVLEIYPRAGCATALFKGLLCTTSFYGFWVGDSNILPKTDLHMSCCVGFRHPQFRHLQGTNLTRI